MYGEKQLTGENVARSFSNDNIFRSTVKLPDTKLSKREVGYAEVIYTNGFVAMSKRDFEKLTHKL